MNYKILMLVIVALASIDLSAQKKNEREFRIEKMSFPQLAQQTLEAIPEKAKRVKFYKEIDNETSSFECKFKYDGKWYSVEFNTEGHLEDIEIRVRKSKIEDAVLENIENYLEKTFEKIDFVKIQKQYLQTSQTSDRTFFSSVLSDTYANKPTWELVLMVKKNKVYEIREMTFDQNGVYIDSRTLEPTSYEYIMY